MKNYLLKTLAGLTIILFANLSFADMYIGAGAYISTLDGTDEKLDDDGDAASAIFIGWKPVKFLALEAGYHDLGGYKFKDDSEVEFTATTVSVSGILPLWLFDWYAKVGYGSVDLDYDSALGSDSESKNESFYALGANLNITSLVDIYAEIEQFSFEEVDVQAFGVGVRINF